MYCCGYPIYHSFSFSGQDYIDYTIILSGSVVYAGRVFNINNNGLVQVDISPVCREHLKTLYESSSDLSGSFPNTVGTFIVNGTSYQVCYNYNENYIFDISTGMVLNHPTSNYVDPRQYIGTSSLSSTGIVISHSKPSGSVGSTITIGGYSFKVVPECQNRYALYYVNKEGGLDYLLCHGKTVDKYSSDKTEVLLYADHKDRRQFSNRVIHQEVSKSYELNTGFITDERSENMHHLIVSPKIWIHDLDLNTITSCTINENSVSIKNYNNDRTYSYTFNVTESQEYIRK